MPCSIISYTEYGGPCTIRAIYYGDDAYTTAKHDINIMRVLAASLEDCEWKFELRKVDHSANIGDVLP